jgi:hypothetical protein
MSDKFTKDYIEERIAARRGALTIKIGAAKEKVAAANEARGKVILDWYEKSVKAVNSAVTARIAADKELVNAKTPEEKYRAVAKYAQGLDKIDRYMPHLIQPARGYDQKTMNRLEKNDPTRLALEIRLWENELEQLDHVSVYFKEAPVTEFTVSSLRSLGLLEAVKFSIAPTAE